jgi:hypothetical protein
MKKIFFIAICLLFVSSSAFALGPVPVSIWLGGAGGSFGAGMNVGMDVGINMPFVPPFLLEAESTGMVLPLVLSNAATSSQRIGLAGRFNIIGDVFKIKLAVGAATLNSNTAFIWGGDNVKTSNSTYYISIGPELSFLGIGLYSKLIAMPLPQATVGEVDFGLLANF